MSKSIQLSVEIAAMNITPVLKYAALMFAMGLQESLKGDSKQVARAKGLTIKLHKDVDFAALKKYKLPTLTAATWEANSDKATQIRDIFKKSFIDNPSTPKEEANLLSFAGLFFANPNKPNYVSRAITAMSSFGPTYSDMFSTVVNGNTKDTVGLDTQKQLMRIVKDITGKAGLKIPADTVKDLKENGDESDQDLIKQYTKIRGELRKQMIRDLASLIVKNNGPIPVFDANNYIEKLGYDEDLLPNLPKDAPLKVGMDGAKIAFFTSDDRMLTGGMPANATNIVFMKTYDPKTGSGGYVSYRTPGAVGETPTKLYTVEHKNAAQEHKFDVADKVSGSLDRFINKWKKDLKSSDPITSMSAAACLLVVNTGMRIGSSITARSATGKATTGALTLKIKELSLKGSNLVLSYIGKKGVKQIHSLALTGPLAYMLPVITGLMKGKKPDDYLFSEIGANGKVNLLRYSQFNGYLKSSGFPGGVHKIRHAKGTQLMMEKLESTKFKFPATAKTLTQKQKVAEDFIKEKVLIPVANLLGHKKESGEPIWQTSIKNYCNPIPVAKWFVSEGLWVPKWVPAMNSKD